MAKVIGNKVPLKILSGMYKTKRLHHAYLLHGPDGVGKFESALNFAKVMFCEKQNGKFCGVCPSCVKITDFRHPDVLVISTDARYRHAKFYYDKLLEKPSSLYFRAFRSNVRNVLQRLEAELLPPYQTYPAAAPPEYMAGSKTDRKRYDALEEHYLALNATISKIGKENYKDLEEIFQTELLSAREYIKSRGGRSSRKKKSEKTDFFKSLAVVYHNITSKIPIDAIRKLISRIERKPTTSRGRITIIEGLELMEASCAAIFLRTLEEPPSGNTFLLTSSNLDEIRKDVITPLRSRTMELSFTSLSKQDVERVFTDVFNFNDSDADKYSEAAEGSVGRAFRAYMSVESDGGLGISESLLRYIRALKDGDMKEALSLQKSICDTDLDASVVLEEIMRILRDGVYLKNGGDEHILSNKDSEISHIFLDISEKTLILFAEELDRLIKESRSKNVRKNLILMKATTDLNALLTFAVSALKGA